MDQQDAITSLIAKFEDYYAFECEGGPLKFCQDWIDFKALLASLIGGRPRCSNDEHVFASPASPGLCDSGSWLIAVAVAEPRTADSRPSFSTDAARTAANPNQEHATAGRHGQPTRSARTM